MFNHLSESFQSIIAKMRFHDDERALSRALEELKRSLVKSDVYYKVLKELLGRVEQLTKAKGIGKESFLNALKQSLEEILSVEGNQGFCFASRPPTTILMAGLQGSGKTTTVAKLAYYLKMRQKKVLVAACDFQRLAAVEQLRQLCDQIEVDLFYKEGVSAVENARLAKSRAEEGLYDVLLIDSAGRLAIDATLMEELAEIRRVSEPYEVFYVADSLSGQDGVKTAMSFNAKIPLGGVILTKFDGDSKGGIALSIAYQLRIPLRFIGVGEKIQDLEVFLPDRVVGRLMGAGDIQSLAEKTATIIGEKEAKQVAKKIKKGNFTFNDFLAQIDNISKIGSMSSILSMIPGLSNMAGAMKGMDLENSQSIHRMRAMISSMTPKERDNPQLLNGSRKRRIALGSGLDISEVNRYIKQFENAAKMAKKFAGKGGMNELLGLMKNAKMNKLQH